MANIRFSVNNKRNKLLNAIYEDVIYKVVNYEDGKKGLVKELQHYINEFQKEPDYKYVQYGNLLAYYSQVFELFANCGYKVDRWNNDTVWNAYKWAVRDVINYILTNK